MAFHELAIVSPAGSENEVDQFDVPLVPVLVTVTDAWKPEPHEPVTAEVTLHFAPEPELCDGDALGEDDGEELGDEDGDGLALALELVLGDALGPVPADVVYVTCVNGALQFEPQEEGSEKE